MRPSKHRLRARPDSSLDSVLEFQSIHKHSVTVGINFSSQLVVTAGSGAPLTIRHGSIITAVRLYRKTNSGLISITARVLLYGPWRGGLGACTVLPVLICGFRYLCRYNMLMWHFRNWSTFTSTVSREVSWWTSSNSTKILNNYHTSRGLVKKTRLEESFRIYRVIL